MATRRKETYDEIMKQHLSGYKVSALGLHSNGIWKGKEYTHILPVEYRELNILEPYRIEFWKWFEKQKIKLHVYFHHLSSSQAMCFNLFFPFIAENKTYVQTLGDVFGLSGTIQDAQFEVVFNALEFTNFDFCITADSKCLFEIKFTEENFGKESPDESHVSKYNRVYSPQMAGKFSEEYSSCDAFLRNYQIMRNAWNLEPHTVDRLVFLVPKSNTRLEADLTVLDRCLSKAYRPRISVVFLEEIVQAFEKTLPQSAARIHEHFRQFRPKYLPALAAEQVPLAVAAHRLEPAVSAPE